MQGTLPCVAYDREPKTGIQVTIDMVHVFYATYLSADLLGQEVTAEVEWP